MTEHLVLIFAYHFPPEDAIGGARPFRLAKYLSKLGYQCRIFTAAEQTGRDDPNTEYVPDPFVTRLRHNLNWQVERVVRKLILPGDVGIRWSYHASCAARAYIRTNPSSRITVFSSFPPLGAHFAAWQLVRDKKPRWIADFRDPMRNERLHEPITQFQRNLDRRLERRFLRRADAVIANTDAAVVRWLKEFPSLARKVHLLWNGFDPEERVLPLPVSGNRWILSHTGELYGGRNVAPVLESIARLISGKRLIPKRILVRLIGPAELATLPNQEFLDRAQKEGWLELRAEQVPKPEALQSAGSSDALLLVQPQSAIQVPGKLFDYLQIGRPILAFIQRNSPAERLLEKSGVPYRCVYPGSSPETMDEIVAGFFELPSTPVEASAWFEEQFNAENQTRQIDAIIRSLHQDSSPGTQAHQTDPAVRP